MDVCWETGSPRVRCECVRKSRLRQHPRQLASCAASYVQRNTTEPTGCLHDDRRRSNVAVCRAVPAAPLRHWDAPVLRCHGRQPRAPRRHTAFLRTQRPSIVLCSVPGVLRLRARPLRQRSLHREQVSLLLHATLFVRAPALGLSNCIVELVSRRNAYCTFARLGDSSSLCRCFAFPP